MAVGSQLLERLSETLVQTSVQVEIQGVRPGARWVRGCGRDRDLAGTHWERASMGSSGFVLRDVLWVLSHSFVRQATSRLPPLRELQPALVSQHTQ
ncbi:hypothetical protein NDU88_004681 [Pleurodeles waltl]|uniref:Uncharacterized protein n=1 Tax=Pleurodeles waltl TaxID=8319 RepID=A0AAV7MW51_PLEWA|nr:hypothetical protein NDU88_004681 [Pleurodeles waltl]